MKKKPSGTISAKTLQNKIKEAKAQMTTTDNTLFELHQIRDQLEVRIATYNELLRDLKPDNADVEAAPKNMTQAAIDYLAANPGAKASEVVNALVETIDSKSSDPKKTLYQTLLNLRNRGRIEKTPEGGLKVAGNGTAPSR